MKNLNLIVFFTMAALVATSQVTINDQKIYGGLLNENLKSLKLPDNEGYIFYGTSNSSVSGNKTVPSYGGNDYWVIKTDVSYNIIWDKVYGGTGNDEGYNAVIIGDNLYIGGISDSPISGNKTINTNGGTDSWFLKLDFSGNIIWQNVFGGTLSESNVMCSNFQENLYVSLSTQSSNSGSISLTNHGLNDIWVSKIDTLNGIVLTQKLLGGTGDETNKQIISHNNRLFLLIDCYGDENGDIPVLDGSAEQDIVLFELNSNLDIVNTRGYWGNLSDESSSIIKDDQSNMFYLIASSNSDISGNKSESSFGNMDFWVIKLDENLNIIWDRVFGGASTDIAVPNSAFVDANGRLLVGGSSMSTEVGGNKTTPAFGTFTFDTWLVILDPSTGNLIKDLSFGGSLDEFPTGIHQLANGKFVISINSSSGISGNKTIPNFGGLDSWVVEVDASNYLELNESEISPDILIFPNPFSDKIFIKTFDKNQIISIDFYSLDGIKFNTQSLNETEIINEIDASNFPKLFIYKVFTDKSVFTGKMIKI